MATVLWLSSCDWVDKGGRANSGLSGVFIEETGVEVVVLMCDSTKSPAVLVLLSVGRTMAAVSCELTLWQGCFES